MMEAGVTYIAAFEALVVAVSASFLLFKRKKKPQVGRCGRSAPTVVSKPKASLCRAVIEAEQGSRQAFVSYTRY